MHIRGIAMNANIELKAQVASLESARCIAQQIAGPSQQIQRQTDTFFPCQSGRLKLREIEGQVAQLIYYRRPNLSSARRSDYLIVNVGDSAATKSLLSHALGAARVVQKRREIYLWKNVRIHLDEVEGLGTFLEFEAVLVEGIDSHQGEEQIRHLQQQFGVIDQDLRSASYAEMLSAN